MPAMMQPKNRGRPRKHTNEMCRTMCGRRYVPGRGGDGKCATCFHRDYVRQKKAEKKKS